MTHPSRGPLLLNKLPSGPALLVFIVAAALFLPFLDKAFHIDDVAFLNVSTMFSWNPLRAIPADMPYMGHVIPALQPYEITHPLFVPYVIKIVRTVFSENERSFHLVFLLFPAIALFSLNFLHRSLHPKSDTHIPVTLLLLAAPAFLVNAQNIMADVPALSFALLGTAFFVHAVENDKTAFLALSSVGLAIGVFISYQTLFIIGVLLAYGYIRNRLSFPVLATLAAPGLLLLSWLLAVYLQYGIFPGLKSSVAHASVAGEIGRGLSPENLRGKAISILIHTGFSTLFVLPLAAVLGNSLLRSSLIWLGFSLAFWPIAAMTGYAWHESLLLAGIAACGALAFYTGLLEFRRGPDRSQKLFLLIWIGTVIAFNLLVLPFGSARYFLPALPAIFILLLSGHSWLALSRARRRLAAAILGMAVLFGFTTARADYQYADIYRNFAREVSQFRSSQKNGATVWYAGEWGMRYYLDRAGARYLLRDTVPKRGDFIIIAEMPRFWEPMEKLGTRMRFYASREYSENTLKLFNGRSHAGFYAHHWGLLPFALSRQQDELFIVYEVI